MGKSAVRFFAFVGAGLAAVSTVALATALAAAPFAAAASATGTPQVETARPVTNVFNGTRVFEAPQVAVDPKDPSTLAMVAGNYHPPGGCYLYISRDSGVTWKLATDSLLPSGYQFCVDRPISGHYARPVFASNGTLYIGFGGAGAAGFPNNPSAALMAVTTDLGATHHTYVVQASHQVTGTNPSTKAPATAMTQVHTVDVAVDPKDPNRVYMSWLLTTTPPAGFKGFVNGVFSVVHPEETMMSVSNDGGHTWSTAVDLTKTAHPAIPTSSGTGVSSMVVAPNGTAYAFASESLAKKAKGPNHLVMYKSTDHGNSWTGSVVGFSVPTAFQSLSVPQVALDAASGELYLAAQVTVGSPSAKSGVDTIYVSSSTNGGQSWATPVDVVDAAASSAYDQYDPGISVAPNGRVDVAWQDFRSDPYYKLGAGGMPVAGSAMSETYYDIYASSSTDQATSWSPNIRVSSQTINSNLGVEFPNFADGPVGISSTNSSMYAAWGSPAAGTPAGSPEDSYFNAVNLSAPVATAAPSTEHNALWGIIGGGSGLLLAALLLLIGTVIGRQRNRPRNAPSPAPPAS
ncbi:MAG: sialidase family protein [Acidimicrobiales bacterium]